MAASNNLLEALTHLGGDIMCACYASFFLAGLNKFCPKIGDNEPKMGILEKIAEIFKKIFKQGIDRPNTSSNM